MTRNEFKVICASLKRCQQLARIWDNVPQQGAALDIYERIATNLCDVLLPPSSANKLARDLFLRDAGVVITKVTSTTRSVTNGEEA